MPPATWLGRPDRRAFLHTLGLAGIPGLVAQAAPLLAAAPPTDPGRVLVLVQLAGGNDGLNTVIPHADDRYFRARPRLAIPGRRVLRLTDHLGFHPEMGGLGRLYRDGGLAIVTNVGYPNPNRSHFKSMDVWETATPPDRVARTGWIGRYLDTRPQRHGLLGLRLGDQAALSLQGERPGSVTLAHPSILEPGTEGPLARGLDQMAVVESTADGPLDHIQRVFRDSRALAHRLREATRTVRDTVQYPPYVLCQSLKLVARMISVGLPTRVYFVTLGGFDTHAAQAERHAGLLQELSEALTLFRQDLRASGQLDRVLLMTFSEFGRRVAENRQGGTDHGTSSSLFLLGGSVKPGVHGGPPDLGQLDDQGDLRFQVDFRSVYASVLKHWLGVDPTSIVGRFAPLPLFRS
ncbi:MAG: DUF1501 domain-containing protein [Gemmataceae bacterium]